MSNLKCQISNGYTLIELLVVISIIGILSVAAFVNLKDFSKDQQLKKAVGEVQSFLRLAQSNATSSVSCSGNYGQSWKVVFSSSALEIKCGNDILIKTLNLQSGITVAPTGFSVNYSALKGVPSLSNASWDSSGKVAITLTNASGTKSLNLTSGGAIDVQ